MSKSSSCQRETLPSSNLSRTLRLPKRKLEKQLTISDCIQTVAIISVQMAIESLHVTQLNPDQIEIVLIQTRNATDETTVIMPKMNLIAFSWLIFRYGIRGPSTENHGPISKDFYLALLRFNEI